jgi:hypothetical protein
VQVDLVAGEEEQHAEPEAGEEVEEVGRLEPEHLRTDQDTEQQLEDHCRDDQPAGAAHGGDGPGHGRDEDDRQELVRIHDLARGEQRRRGHRPIAAAPAGPRIIRCG